MNRFKLNQRWSFSGPSTWDELTPRQAVVAMRFRNRVNDQQEIIFPVLELIYGITLRQQRWLFDAGFLRRKGLTEEQIGQSLANGQALIDTLRWVGETEPGSEFLIPFFKLLDYQYGSARVLLQRACNQTLYHSPADGLASCTFGEFIFADQAYRTQNYAQLAAILYRPAGKKRDGDSREPFDVDQVDSRAELFEQLDEALLLLIVAQFEACMRELQRTFPLVFQQKTDEQTTTEGGSSSGWINIAISMAKLDLTKVPKIEQANLYLALQVLSEQIRQADELEEQLEAARKK